MTQTSPAPSTAMRCEMQSMTQVWGRNRVARMRAGAGGSRNGRGALGHWSPTRERNEKALLIFLSQAQTDQDAGTIESRRETPTLLPPLLCSPLQDSTSTTSSMTSSPCAMRTSTWTSTSTVSSAASSGWRACSVSGGLPFSCALSALSPTVTAGISAWAPSSPLYPDRTKAKALFRLRMGWQREGYWWYSTWQMFVPKDST